MVLEIQRSQDVAQAIADSEPRYFYGKMSSQTMNTAFKVAEVLTMITAFAGICFKLYSFFEGKTIKAQDLSDLNDLLGLLK